MAPAHRQARPQEREPLGFRDVVLLSLKDQVDRTGFKHRRVVQVNVLPGGTLWVSQGKQVIRQGPQTGSIRADDDLTALIFNFDVKPVVPCEGHS